MNDDQLLKSWKEFKATKDRLDQLPKTIDELIASELQLLKNAYLNDRADLKAEVDKIRKRREQLQTELIECRAILPVLKRQLVDTATKVGEERAKAEKARIAELKENIEAAKSRFESSVAEAFKTAVELWGRDLAKERAMGYMEVHANSYLQKHPELLHKIGMERQLLELANQPEKERDAMYQIQKILNGDEQLGPVRRNELPKESKEKSKEEKVRQWITALVEAKRRSQLVDH